LPQHINDPDLNLAALIARWPQTIPVFFQHKMLCVGCLVSRFHTISDACEAYGLIWEDLLLELESAIAGRD